jgi:carboxymethylenebutenolidase
MIHDEKGAKMMRRALSGLLAICLLGGSLALPTVGTVHGASAFADPAFQAQWQQGEAVTPNFWGPLANAKDGQQEPYQQAASGERLVQYFDKGRMELTNGTITNGLLATELVKGQIQIGDATFQPQAPPAIPIAGDPDNPGPTYAQLGGTASTLLVGVAAQAGTPVTTTLGAGGIVGSANQSGGSGPIDIAAYDDATQHNVPQAFADYRAKAGIPVIGLAISEPFLTAVKVAGQMRRVMVQVFERRVLTYTADNPPAFQVEMGNIGQHYYRWRYTGAPQSAPPATLTAPPNRTEVTFPSGDLQLHGYIWKPAGNGPFPAVLWNHGSDKDAEMPFYPDLWPLYVNAGYVFFIPFRRGQGDSPGLWMDDVVNAAPPSQRNQLVVQLHETVELDDQLAGLAYLKTLPYVDTNRIAVSGWSYGGIQTILGAEANPGYRAAIDCAGGALSWDRNPDLRARMIAAVQKITIPIFLMQARNDATTGPSEALAAEFARLGKPYQEKIYPLWHTTTNFTSVPEGHLICGEGEAVWGADALAFLKMYLQ